MIVFNIHLALTDTHTHTRYTSIFVRTLTDTSAPTHNLTSNLTATFKHTFKVMGLGKCPHFASEMQMVLSLKHVQAHAHTHAPTHTCGHFLCNIPNMYDSQ